MSIKKNKKNIHNFFLNLALEQAKRNLGNTKNNPSVGCLIVKNGIVIGEGWHKKYGESHAEINALNNCSEDPSGADFP